MLDFVVDGVMTVLEEVAIPLFCTTIPAPSVELLLPEVCATLELLVEGTAELGGEFCGSKTDESSTLWPITVSPKGVNFPFGLPQHNNVVSSKKRSVH